MNQDDTFKRLRRTPIEELDPIYRKRFWEFYTSSDEIYTKWLSEHGWTDRDFIAAGKEYERRESRRNDADLKKNLI